MAAKLQRVGTDHPECCQGTTGSQQCEYKRVAGSPYCQVHGPVSMQAAAEKAELKQYRLNSIFAGRAKDFAKSSQVKNLTDEIALMRTTLEGVFNGINNVNELMLYSDKIDKLSSGIAKLTDTWQKLQERNKELMGRDEVIALFDELLNKIIERVTDPDAIALLAEDCRVILEKGLGGEVS
jgi:hypothetical protein